MPFILTVPPQEASGALKAEYARIESTRGGIGNIFRITSLHPGSMGPHLDLYQELHFGESPGIGFEARLVLRHFARQLLQLREGAIEHFAQRLEARVQPHRGVQRALSGTELAEGADLLPVDRVGEVARMQPQLLDVRETTRLVCQALVLPFDQLRLVDILDDVA